MSKLNIKYKLANKKAQIPFQKNPDNFDAGYDLVSTEHVIIEPLARALIDTGVILEIPKGYYGHICPRSGLALKSGIQVMAGIIDCSYRDTIKVLLYNSNVKIENNGKEFSSFFGSDSRVTINPGDRIAQILFKKVEQVEFVAAESLSETDRGTGGFGSTGK